MMEFNNEIDFIFSLGVIHHIPQAEEVCKKIYQSEVEFLNYNFHNLGDEKPFCIQYTPCHETLLWIQLLF